MIQTNEPFSIIPEQLTNKSKTMSKFIHELGVEAKDKITGFKGVIVARSEHITGCNTYGLRGSLDKDGKVQECEWFDEAMLDVTGKGIEPNDVTAEDKGGPLSNNPPG